MCVRCDAMRAQSIFIMCATRNASLVFVLVLCAEKRVRKREVGNNFEDLKKQEEKLYKSISFRLKKKLLLTVHDNTRE
jgi:hypothetical protein